jgi:undecaprenyl-diphosphatase
MTNSFSDLIANGFLFCTRESTIILLTTLGYLGFKRDVFAKALCLLLFSMIFNAFLKSIWQIPLPTGVGDGFAFPSGHMQTATIFWFWIGLEFRHKFLWLLIAFLLSGIAFGLVHFNYHTLPDVLGAMFFATLTLTTYTFLLKIPFFRIHTPASGLILALISVPLLYYNTRDSFFLWLANGSLFGFSLGWLLQSKSDTKIPPLKIKLIQIAVALLGVLAIKCLFLRYIPHPHQAFGVFIVYFVMGFWVSGVAPLIGIKRLKSEH